MRFGALQETRALRPPQIVLPKKLDFGPPASAVSAGHNLRISGFVEGSPAGCARNVRSFGNAVLRAYTSPPRAASTGRALTSNAAQVAGLGRIYFEFLCPDSGDQPGSGTNPSQYRG